MYRVLHWVSYDPAAIRIFRLLSRTVCFGLPFFIAAVQGGEWPTIAISQHVLSP